MVNSIISKIGLGGGCHWCTEAVFTSLNGVINVQQGYILSEGKAATYSEAIIVLFNPDIISLDVLIEIHLRTHKSTSNHSFREKYRSAVYIFNEIQATDVKQLLQKLQSKFPEELITQILGVKHFKESRKELLNYFYNNPDKPFCRKYIDPKLKLLLGYFGNHLTTRAKDIFEI
jgi:peptide-methionine (S)-S-oxide reductase